MRQSQLKKYPLFLFAGVISLCCWCCSKKAETVFNLIPPSHSGVNFSNNIIEDDTSNLVDYYYVYNGGGVAIGDINNDGLPDIYFTGNQVGDRLYLNRGNFKFDDITIRAGIQKSGWSTGVTMVDINADGLLDIYVCKSGNFSANKRANQLYINKGNVTFEEQAIRWGLADTTHTNQAAFFDYDKDGDLDAYLITSTNSIRNPNKLMPLKRDGTGLSVDRLLQNQGQFFVDVSKKAGIMEDGFGLGLAIHDLNGDGWEDILVTNDFVANDHLYVNNRDGTFTESAKHYFRHHGNFSMGNDVSDYNNDGLPDVVVVDMLPADAIHRKKMAGTSNPNAYEAMIRAGYHPQFMRNMLYLNLGKDENNAPVFAEIGQQVGVHSTDWSWSPLWGDFDHDGWQDLFITNGYLRDVTDMDFIIHNNRASANGDKLKINKSMRDGASKLPSIRKNNYLFKNNRGEGFSDESLKYFGDHSSLSNGASIADLDNDGDLDIVINNINETAFVLQNNTDHSHYLKVKLIGPTYNTKGIGSQVTIYYGGILQTQHLFVTRGYQSSVDYTLNFGLGKRNIIDSIEVRWPDGKMEVKKELMADQLITLDYRTSRRKTSMEKKSQSFLLKDITGLNGLNFVHQEEFYMDYNVEPLLPHKFSQQGPCIASADIDGDGLEDFFVGGSYKHQGMIFKQNSNLEFESKPILRIPEKQEEDTDALFVDTDNDGDRDLYVVSGSNEFLDGSEFYQDRLYINNGMGQFEIDHSVLPNIRHSGSCVAAVDYDKDGDIDLFRGGRLKSLEFPKPGVSYLFSNENGKFKDITDSAAPGLRNIGMVTDACWVDIDNDGWHDLIIVGEYMPITIFKNTKGNLNRFQSNSLENTNGLWNSVVSLDIDNDGDQDFIIGNRGLNSRYRFTRTRPFSIYCGDFDSNGSWDAIPAYYDNDTEYPVPPLFDLVRQLPMLKKNYPTFDKYAHATMSELLTTMKSEVKFVLSAYEQRSVIVENFGNSRFEIRPLPEPAQRSPITDISAIDINQDGNTDLISIGNDYSIEPIEGQIDGGVGMILLGNGKGDFSAVSPKQSGLLMNGDAKKMVVLNWTSGKLICATQNKGELRCFSMLNEQ